MDDVKLPEFGTANARYYRSEDWHFDCTPEMVPVIINSKGGKIILGDTVKKVLETIDGNTFEEIDRQQIFTPGLTEIFLKVFTRVGILYKNSHQDTKTQRQERKVEVKVKAEVKEAAPFGDATRRLYSNFNASGEPHTTMQACSHASLKSSSCSHATMHPHSPRTGQCPVPTDSYSPGLNPLVSVVIVNYNGDAQLPDLLDSLKRQTYRHLEIIVVDNDSTDNSCAWVKANYNEVRLMELKKNTGFAAGANTGIGSAGGDLILLLNNDIVLEDDAIDELVHVVLSNDRPWAAAAPKMKFFNNPAFINAIGNSFYPFGWGSDNYIGQVDFDQYDHITESLSACFGAVLLNSRVIKKIGGLDPRYRFYYEDLDWCYRAQVQGFPVITAPKAVIYHKFGASMSLKSRTFKTRFIVGNRLYFSLKNLGRRSLRRFLVNYFFEDIKSTFYYLGKLNFPMVWAYARGYGRFLVSLPGLIYKRRKLQKQRIIKDDGVILAKAAPVDDSVMQNGAPKLDIHSLMKIFATKAPRH